MDNISVYLEKIENALKLCMPHLPEETAYIKDMLEYSLESGGKRIRPVLCLMFCKALGGNPDNALPFACAVEFVHTYSLIHDDLPCMDNDDLRRGKLSSHKKFGEANALLAGDALLTQAFSIISDAPMKADITPLQALRAVKELSVLAGMTGMVGGQYIDLKYENENASLPVLFQMDSLKTGALIEAACVLGLIAAGGTDDELSYARQFARELGLAFQIVDDLIEVDDENDNSDEINGKATYVSLFGIEKAKEIAAIHTKNALEALDYFGSEGQEIRDFAQSLLNRKK